MEIHKKQVGGGGGGGGGGGEDSILEKVYMGGGVNPRAHPLTHTTLIWCKTWYQALLSYLF